MIIAQIIIYLNFFIIGVVLGSFFTLPTYRIPLKQDITHTRSYCPKCNHKFVYNLNLDDIKEVNSNKSVQNEKTQYEFLSYVICKNPLCNYDIELKGYIFEYPENTVDSVELIKLK